MKIEQLHEWRVTTAQAVEIQRGLAARVSTACAPGVPCFIAGVDISATRGEDTGTGAVVVLSYPEMELVEVQVVTGRLDFPYVPGLLSFREAPLTLAACGRLGVTPDLFLVDGHGYAHPRRMGIACHLGLFLNTPTIGCAKSVLCGSHEMPGVEPGSWTPLVDGDEVIGAALRTKFGIKPVYVSVGHRIDLQGAIDWVLRCCRGCRLPEPARLAHLAATGNLKAGELLTNERARLAGILPEK